MPSGTTADFEMAEASPVNSKLPGQTDLRTTGPGTVSTLTMVHPILGHRKIDRVTATYRYLAGYAY